MKKLLHTTKSLLGTARFLTASFILFLISFQGHTQGCGAGFSYSAQNNYFYFQDSSYTIPGDSITGWAWTFGDSTIGTGAFIQHQYNAAGTYVVCLTITTAQGCSNTACHNVTVFINPCQLVVNVLPDSTGSGLFVAISNGTAPYTFNWSTGETTAGILTPSPGYYCVVVTDANGCSATDCDSGGVTWCSPYFTSSAAGNIVYFQNNSAGTYSSVIWDFGDTTTSSQLNPIHTYANGGSYTVCLTLLDSNGNSCNQYCTQIFVSPPSNATLCGYIFVDSNGNGVYDSTETLLSNQLITIYGGGIQMTLVTDSFGYYTGNFPAGTYYISYCPNNGGIVTLPIDSSPYCGQYYSVVIAANQTACGYNFAVQYTSVTIQGFIFADINLNGIADAGEPGIPYQYVSIGGNSVYTNSTGYYSTNVAAGTYNIQYTPQGSYSSYPLTTASSISLNAATIGNIYTGNNFGLNIPAGTTDITVQLLPNTTVSPGFGAWYDIYVCNNGLVPVAANVTMVYDPALFFNYSYPAQSSVNTSTHTITWTTPLITPGNCWSTWVDFTADSNLAIGTSTFEFVSAFPTSGIDGDLTNNTDSIHQICSGSWDPNNKLSIQTNTVNPNEQYISSVNPDQEIKYTVNFQNTGTGSAVNIVVIDELSTDIDASSFQVTATSHPCTISRTGNQVIYTFSNIMLPASSMNTTASHGFISFKANALTGLAAGTILSDKSNIYFDFNQPVVTGNTHIVMIDPLGVNEISNHVQQLTVYPVPVKDVTSIDFNLKENAFVKVELIDMNGRVCQTIASSQQQSGSHTISWKPEVNAGNYFVRLSVNGRSTLTKINVVK